MPSSCSSGIILPVYGEARFWLPVRQKELECDYSMNRQVSTEGVVSPKRQPFSSSSSYVLPILCHGRRRPHHRHLCPYYTFCPLIHYLSASHSISVDAPFATFYSAPKCLLSRYLSQNPDTQMFRGCEPKIVNFAVHIRLHPYSAEKLSLRHWRKYHPGMPHASFC